MNIRNIGIGFWSLQEAGTMTDMLFQASVNQPDDHHGQRVDSLAQEVAQQYRNRRSEESVSATSFKGSAGVRKPGKAHPCHRRGRAGSLRHFLVEMFRNAKVCRTRSDPTSRYPGLKVLQVPPISLSWGCAKAPKCRISLPKESL